MTDNLIAQAEAALDVIHRLSQAQGYDGDAVGCARCTDADAAIWHNDEPICQDCANRIMERAYESAGVSALLARIAAQEAQMKADGERAAELMIQHMRAAEAAETALAAERAKTAKLVEAGKALGLREIVAGWNGEGKEKPYTPHPAHLWATIKTTCGAVYALDAAITEAGHE